MSLKLALDQGIYLGLFVLAPNTVNAGRVDPLIATLESARNFISNRSQNNWQLF